MPEVYRRLFEVYSRVRDYQDLQHYRVRRYEMVWDMFGRPRQIPEQAVAKSITSRITSLVIIIPNQVREFFHVRRLERSTTQVECQIRARWRV